ncbi:MAG: hypothetical protein QNK37_21285 [Acidobacteriota bacterium]|nr:hypothetical protein [Acidobacteriota bacterium]
MTRATPVREESPENIPVSIHPEFNIGNIDIFPQSHDAGHASPIQANGLTVPMSTIKSEAMPRSGRVAPGTSTRFTADEKADTTETTDATDATGSGLSIRVTPPSEEVDYDSGAEADIEDTEVSTRRRRKKKSRRRPRRRSSVRSRSFEEDFGGLPLGAQALYDALLTMDIDAGALADTERSSADEMESAATTPGGLMGTESEDEKAVTIPHMPDALGSGGHLSGAESDHVTPSMLRAPIKRRRSLTDLDELRAETAAGGSGGLTALSAEPVASGGTSALGGADMGYDSEYDEKLAGLMATMETGGMDATTHAAGYHSDLSSDESDAFPTVDRPRRRHAYAPRKGGYSLQAPTAEEPDSEMEIARQFLETYGASASANLNTVTDASLMIGTKTSSTMKSTAKESGGDFPNPYTPALETVGEVAEFAGAVKEVREALATLKSSTASAAEKDLAKRTIRIKAASMGKSTISATKNVAGVLKQSHLIDKATTGSGFMAGSGSTVAGTMATAGGGVVGGIVAARHAWGMGKAIARKGRIGRAVSIDEGSRELERSWRFKRPDKEVPEEGYSMGRIGAYYDKKTGRKIAHDAVGMTAGAFGAASVIPGAAVITAPTAIGLSSGLAIKSMGKSMWKRGRKFDKRTEMAKALHWFAHQTGSMPKACYNWRKYHESRDEHWDASAALADQKEKAERLILALVKDESRKSKIIEDTKKGWKLLFEKGRST